MILSLLKRLGADRSGGAALEFALVAPVMVSLYFGSIELTQAFLAQNKAGHVAAAVGDLVARARSVSTSDLSDYFSIGTEIMEPFPSTGLGIRVSSLTEGASGAPTVSWSRGYGSMAARTVGSAVTIPLALNPGDTVIMSESSYQYNSLLHQYVPQAMTFSQTNYLRPRLSDAVTCSGC
jgi:Flp pilus assembly protein TadG